jgi:hypothetical protein
MRYRQSNKSVAYVKSSDSFRFAVFGQSHEPGNDVERTLTTKLTDTINKYYESAAFVGSTAHGLTKNIKKPFASTYSGYKSYDIKNSRFIQLDISKGGLRKSNSSQWSWFLNQLNSSKGSNVFIFLAGAPGNFSDSLEAELFQTVLSDYKKRRGKEYGCSTKAMGAAVIWRKE